MIVSDHCMSLATFQYGSVVLAPDAVPNLAFPQ